jgi:hypothetical protein
LASVADKASAISPNNVIELGKAAFIRFRHTMDMASREAVSNCDAKGAGGLSVSDTCPAMGSSFGSPNTTLADFRQWVLDRSTCALQDVPIGSFWEEEDMPFDGIGYEGCIDTLDKIDK